MNDRRPQKIPQHTARRNGMDKIEKKKPASHRRNVLINWLKLSRERREWKKNMKNYASLKRLTKSILPLEYAQVYL